MPPDNNKTFGARGEADTSAFLEARGYRLIDANVRPFGGMARGELDLIAWQGDTLVFIEVKTRRTAWGRQGTPAEAVDVRKQKQLVALASAYLAHHALDDIPCRFDVVEVIERDGQPPHFTLIPDAFDATE